MSRQPSTNRPRMLEFVRQHSCSTNGTTRADTNPEDADMLAAMPASFALTGNDLAPHADGCVSGDGCVGENNLSRRYCGDSTVVFIPNWQIESIRRGFVTIPRHHLQYHRIPFVPQFSFCFPWGLFHQGFFGDSEHFHL